VHWLNCYSAVQFWNPFVCSSPAASIKIVTLILIVGGVFLAPSAAVWKASASDVEGTGSTGTNYRDLAFRKGRRGSNMLRMFCLSRWYNYLLIVQINTFRPRPSRSARKCQSFQFSVKIFSRSALAGKGSGAKNFSLRGPSSSLVILVGAVWYHPQNMLVTYVTSLILKNVCICKIFCAMLQSA
jgi:hypothetical protein